MKGCSYAACVGSVIAQMKIFWISFKYGNPCKPIFDFIEIIRGILCKSTSKNYIHNQKWFSDY